MGIIRANNGTEIQVDDADIGMLSRYRWHLKGGRYPRTKIKYQFVYMARLLMEPPEGMVVDHISGNTLDNRRVNLRVCTNKENVRNRKARAGRTSTYKGISWVSREKKWRAKITVDGHELHAGYFDTEREAAYGYDKAARKHFGEFARCNFPAPA